MVYVDDGNYHFRRMIMCHMIADTTEELLAMANKIRVARKWIQKPGTTSEHFDICQSKRALAVKQGAKEITGRDLALLLRAKRSGEALDLETVRANHELAIKQSRAAIESTEKIS